MDDKKEQEFTDEEKRKYAMERREFLFGEMMFAQGRTSELSDQIISLEVQIAVVLLAFTQFFSDSIFKRLDVIDHTLKLALKFTYLASVSCLVISLALGLIHLFRKEKFWDEQMAIRIARLRNWGRFIRREQPYEQAIAYDEGVNANKGDISRTPKWTWILQTTVLSLAIILIFLMFSILLFVE